MSYSATLGRVRSIGGSIPPLPLKLNIMNLYERLKPEVKKAIKVNAKKLNINTLAGGGDTVSAIKNTNAEDGFHYISNAGGAFLEWLEGNESPGVVALKENKII